MIFTTKSGSIYQIDAEAKRIRQIKGSSTKYGGEWFNFIALDVRPGLPAVIAGDDPDRCIITSVVVSVVPCLN